MKIIQTLKSGGLTQKIVRLLMAVIVLFLVSSLIISGLRQKNMSKVIHRTNEERSDEIKDVSEETIGEMIDSYTMDYTELQADIAEDFFLDAKADVLTLSSIASEILERKDLYKPHPFQGPQGFKKGESGVWVTAEKGVDPNESETLALLANMSDTLFSMYENSDSLDSLFVATADGCFLVADNSAYLGMTDKGETIPYPVRERDWYRQAVKAKELIFTGVLTDFYTNNRDIICAAPVYKDGKLIAVVGADVFLSAIHNAVEKRETEDRFLCVIDGEGKVVMSSQTSGVFMERTAAEAWDLRENDNKALADFVKNAMRAKTGLVEVSIYGQDFYLCGCPLENSDLTVISVTRKEIVDKPTNTMLKEYDRINDAALNAYTESAYKALFSIIIIAVIIAMIAGAGGFMMAKSIVTPLMTMTRRIDELENGENIFEMEDVYRTGDEVEVLAQSFATLSERTKNYIEQVTSITAEKERIGAELSLATGIQADMLPKLSAVFAVRPEFVLDASMKPAKEVSGDFYDFFFVDDDHLGLVMADVAGKGIPAAMFMIAAKNIIANNVLLGKTPARALSDSNKTISSNNSETMFVTVWAGVLEISTGVITAVNAGHEKPVLYRSGEQFELYDDHCANIPVGVVEDMEYGQYELTLSPGDKIFFYTDGVPEAQNGSGELFGEERMVEALNEDKNASPEQMCSNMRAAIGAFVDEAEQFDDLTMLALEYRGPGGNTNED